MQTFVESVVDMHTISPTPIMEAIMSGLETLIESGDFGYSGSLRPTGISKAAVRSYMANHPECASPDEAYRKIQQGRERFNARIIDHTHDPKPKPNMIDRAELFASASDRDRARIGSFIIVPGSYGSPGKITDIQEIDGTTYVTADVVTKSGEIYTQDHIPAYNMEPCTNPAKIDRWNRAHGIVPEESIPDNSGIRRGSEVTIHGGDYDRFDATYDGPGNNGMANVTVMFCGSPRHIQVPYEYIKSEQPALAPKVQDTSWAGGRPIKKAVWHGR